MMKNHESKKCRATSKRTGERCRRWASPGRPVCHYHGAKAGAPKGNRNALSTGLYERVDPERLTEEERALFDSIPADPDLTTELRLLRLLLLKMLDSLERRAVVGTPDGAEVVTLTIDEVATALAAEKLCDGIRKLVKDASSTPADFEAFERLLAVLQKGRG